MLSFIIVTSIEFLFLFYQTPIFVQIFTVINFIRIHFESILIILFKGHCESIPTVFNSHDIKESQLNSNLYHLIIEAIIFRIIVIIIMLFQTILFFIRLKMFILEL